MRLLIVDEDLARHDRLRAVFASLDVPVFDDGVIEFSLRDDAVSRGEMGDFEYVYHRALTEAAAEVRRSVVSGQPFAIALIGSLQNDNIGAVSHALREADGNLNLAFVVEDQDDAAVNLRDIAAPADKVFFLTGSYDVDEIGQTVLRLAARWQADRELGDIRARLARQHVLLGEQAAELAANESRAVHLANHDPLTEAPNRVAFLRAVAERARQPGVFAVATVDLDRFKFINDTLGYVTGDEVLRQTCCRLEEVAPENSLIARLAGDEFGLLFDTAGDEAAEMTCDRLVAGCHLAMRVLGHKVQTSVSAGVVVSHEREVHDPLDLMRKADLALNDAKRGGRNMARLFDARMDEGVRVRRAVQDGLSRSIERGELDVLFQPILANGSLQIVGFEALLRWYTDEFGPISPATFIPIAEESDLIHELGDWVLARSLDAVKTWPDHYVSINFSPRQFGRTNFVGHLMKTVQRAGVDPRRLQIEITETALFDDVERAAETLYRLRQMGFRVALDDFGTGYSNLYNIRKFALDALKIDRSFTDGLVREPVSAAIVRSIAQLGQALNVEVIAEGVETEAQVALLTAAGASHFQGFLFAHPLRSEDARSLAENGLVAEQQECDPVAIAPIILV